MCLSVVVPAHRAPDRLARCIDALRASDLPADQWELVVADDGSDDDATATVAQRADRAIALPSPAGGPARARNAGALAARASIVAFVDADVLVHTDALSRMLAAFGDSSVAAVCGSYDDKPAAPGAVSQYRNLLHHYVHQRNAGDVESFWAGCGAVRKAEFSAVGMFDADRFRRPEMEDVELGYRLREAGYRIVLDPRILCTHLKRWTLGGMIKSDFARRGIPWAQILVERGMLLKPRGLSLGGNERLSALFALATIAAALYAAACTSTPALALSAILAILFVTVNWKFFARLSSIRGPAFAARSILFHLVYNAVAATGFVFGAVLAMVKRPIGRARYTRPR